MASLLAHARALKNFPAQLAYRRSLKARELMPPQGAPALNYGSVLGVKGGLIHGGKVKLLHLRERYPERDDFNLLYLVSSATPPYAIELVRWAKAGGARLVWNQNGVAFPAWAGTRATELNRPMAALLKEADFVVYQSAFCRESSNRHLGSTDRPHAILFNPVNLREFRPAERRPEAQPWKLLVAGTHHQRERVLLPLEALRNMLDAGLEAQLTVAGELRWPHGTREVAAEIERLNIGDKVNVVPPFTQNEAVTLYQTHHVLLHLKYQDPCPTVVIEAMACGLPVIGSASGGMPELVGEDGGRLMEVPLGFEKSAYPGAEVVAEAVRKLMRGNWREASERARVRAERLFDANEWVNEHTRIFGQVLT